MVVPLPLLSNATGVLAKALNWSIDTLPHANTHESMRTIKRSKLRLLELAGDLMSKHNAWDQRLYHWVVKRWNMR